MTSTFGPIMCRTLTLSWRCPWKCATTRSGLVPAALEMLDRFTLRAVEDWKHLGLDADAEVLLLAQLDAPGQAGDQEAAALAEVFRGAGALWAEQSTDEARVECDSFQHRDAAVDLFPLSPKQKARVMRGVIATHQNSDPSYLTIC